MLVDQSVGQDRGLLQLPRRVLETGVVKRWLSVLDTRAIRSPVTPFPADIAWEVSR
jgi:hypothetical protein